MSDSEAEFSAKVLYDFAANTENELSIAAGEVVTVLEEDHPWAHVRNVNGYDGYVPINYIERIDDPADAPPPRPNVASPVTERTMRGKIAAGLANLPPSPTNPAPDPMPMSRNRASSMDNSPAWNIFAASLEWWACLTLFISGIFSLMWGSAQVPDDKLDETMGTVSCIVSGIFLIYFSMFREIGAEKAAIIRAIILLGSSAICWASAPMGALGGGALVLAGFANIIVWIKRSALLSDSKVANAQWLTMSLDWSGVFKTSKGAVIFMIFHIGANVGYYFLGHYLGEQKIEQELLDNRLELSESHAHAEGWGVIISMNLVWLFLFSMYGLHDYLINWVQLRIDENGCCIRYFNRTVIWLFLDKRQLFLHRVFSTTILIASVAHMFESYNAWESSGTRSTYIKIFGQKTFITGTGAVWCLIIIFAAVSPELVNKHRKLFIVAHSFWGVLVLLLLIHGKHIFGTHFWKFIVGPLSLYLMDRLFRCGGEAGAEHERKFGREDYEADLA